MTAQGSRMPVIEPNDPLFIHPSDHPGQILVADAFNGEDFDSWKRTFLIALSSKNKVGFVDGRVSKPANDSPLLPHWQRCNDLVASWILNSLHKDISGSVLYCNTAEEMWRELVERFGQSNKAKLFQVKKDLSGIVQGDSDIATYYTRAKKTWDEFAAVDDMPRCTCKKCECDVNTRLLKYTQEQNMIYFLMGLNESYTSVRGNLLMMNPLPSLGQTYSLLIQEEKQRQVKNVSHFQSDSACSFNVGTQRSNFQRRPEGRRISQLFCDHCKRQGHTIDKCYKLHGYPNKQPPKPKGGRFASNVWADGEIQAEASKPAASIGSCNSSVQSIALPGLDSDQSKQLLQFLANLHASKQSHQESFSQGVSATHMAGISLTSLQYVASADSVCCTCNLDGTIWVIDSGASDHMVCDYSLLHNIRSLKVPVLITLPNGSKVKCLSLET